MSKQVLSEQASKGKISIRSQNGLIVLKIQPKTKETILPGHF